MASTVSSRYPSAATSRASSPAPSRKQFRFFDLPSELRLRIYEEILLTGATLDLDPLNYRRVLPRLNLFLVSRRMHSEAYRVFYSQPVRLYPLPSHGRFFHTKRPLLARLPPRYRRVVTTAELRLGPGWSAPPRGQNTDASLGLRDCESLRTLRVFVECDPSDTIFTGFRGKGATEETYKLFCLGLLEGIFQQVPGLEVVEIDAYPAVKKNAPLVLGLRRKIAEYGKRLVWGPLRGWEKEGDEPGLIGLESALAGMGLGEKMPVLEVKA